MGVGAPEWGRKNVYIQASTASTNATSTITTGGSNKNRNYCNAAITVLMITSHAYSKNEIITFIITESMGFPCTFEWNVCVCALDATAIACLCVCCEWCVCVRVVCCTFFSPFGSRVKRVRILIMIFLIFCWSNNDIIICAVALYFLTNGEVASVW